MAAIRPALKARADGHDEITGEPLPDGVGHAHHRHRRGGPELDTLANLVYLAPNTHGWVHSRVTLSRRFGWILRAWMKPADEPIYYRGSWVLLDDEGGITPTETPEKTSL